MSKERKVMGQGIVAQMKESNTFSPGKLTKKDFKEFLGHMEKSYIAQRKQEEKLNKEWLKHWADKRKKFPNEEPPMWLVLKTHPSSNRGTGGVFLTSREVIDKNKKWLT